jgi:hypothetical protein
VGKPGGSLERVGWLTPYVGETLTEDALWAGAGGQLELTLPADTPAADVAWVRNQFARLRARGVRVDVHCDQGPEALRVDPAETVAAARPEQLRFPFRAGRRRVIWESMSGEGAAEEGAAHEDRSLDQGLPSWSAAGSTRPRAR